MISLSAIEEELVCELRTRLQLPLDDIAEVMHRCVNEKLSRSAIHRCLVRHGLNRRPSPDKPLVGVFETAVDSGELGQRIALERPPRLTPIMFEYELIERARAAESHIVLPEGDDDRVVRPLVALRPRTRLPPFA